MIHGSTHIECAGARLIAQTSGTPQCIDESGALEVAAETDEAAKRANGRCASAFFIAMDALRRGDRTRAREQLQLTEARCPTISEFNWAATSELKRL